MTASALRLSPRSSNWWNDYVGTPFLWHGYSHEGASCWGLVCLVYSEVYGVALPRHDELISSVEQGGGSPRHWTMDACGVEVPLEEAEEGDVLHMWGFYKGRRRALHCGLVTERGRVLHAEEKTDAVISRYTGPMFSNRVIGAYRLAL